MSFDLTIRQVSIQSSIDNLPLLPPGRGNESSKKDSYFTDSQLHVLQVNDDRHWP